MRPDAVALIPMRKRGRPRKRPFPVPRRQLLDAAKREALSVGLGTGQSGAKMHRDCGSLSSSERWFCVQTHPGQERRAAQELRQQDFLVFLPVGIVERHRRITVRHETPRYLFVAFDPATTPWRRICHTYGVARLFMFGDHTPAPARRGDVERLIMWVAEQIGRPDPVYGSDVVGQVGTVADGPFAQFRCVVVAQEPDGRLTVNVEIFGRSSPVTLERDAVRLDGP